MSDKTPLAQALAKLDEAMRPSLGGSADPARRRAAQRLAQLARCEDKELPEFAKRHMPGGAVEESGLRAARDLLLAIGGIADMEEGGPDAWAALAEVKQILERRLAEAKETALKRKAEAEDAGLSKVEEAADGVDVTASQPGAIEPAFVAGLQPGGDTSRMPFPFVPLSAPLKPLEGRRVPDDPEATMAGEHMALRRPALPFDPPSSPMAQGLRPGMSEPPKLDPRLPADHDPLKMTREFQSPMGPVLPFRPSAEGPGAKPTLPPPPPVEPAPRAFVAEPQNELSLAQYASLCAELSVFPEETERVFRRYGLDADEKRSAVDAAWKKRLRHEPAEYEAWQELYRRYHAHWTKQRTSPQDDARSGYGRGHPRRG